MTIHLHPVDSHTWSAGMLLIRVDVGCRITGLYLATGGAGYVKAGSEDARQRAKAQWPEISAKSSWP